MFSFTFPVKVCLSAMALLSTSYQALATPKLSEKMAKDTATAFCQQLNATQQLNAATVLTPGDQQRVRGGSVSPTIKFISPDARHGHIRWKVSLPNQVEVLVDDDTGLVDEYSNEGFYNRHDTTLSGQAMSRAEAIQQAIAVLKSAAGPVSSVTLDDAYERQDGTKVEGEGRASGHFWQIWLRTTYKGIPFRDQDAYVQLQAETGEVVRAGMEFDLLPPPSIEEIVTRDQAVAIGQAQLAAAGITGSPLIWEHKMIIQPDTFWQDGNGRPSSNTTRTAWLCGFGSQECTYGVWIDTQTGDVIGGTIGGILGGGPVKRQKPIFGHQLKHVAGPKKSSR